MLRYGTNPAGTHMADLTPQGQNCIKVDCRGVSFQAANGTTLVSDLNLSIRQGETLVLVGESGSGKTTTLKLINRLLDPTRGEVLVDGRATTDWDPIRLRRSIGYVIQEIGLMPHFTVEKNVGLVPMLEGWGPERIGARTQELLKIVGLDPGEFGHRFPHQLSGGQRQRVGVARALAADPPILLMDEPFGALDPVTRSELQQEFRSLKNRLRKTIIFVTHDLREGLMMADRIGLMAGGRLIAVLPPAEFMRVENPEIKSIVAVHRTRTEFDF